MNVSYSVNGESAELYMPATYLLVARAEDLAELVASDFWRTHQGLPEVFQVHLQNVDGVDLGMFEVRSETRPVFTATAVAKG
ncbi:hypothetical protein D3C77_603900 [compost metagenome]